MCSTSLHFKISLNHLKALPLYRTEKPYELWLPVEPGLPKTNVEFEYCTNIPVSDVRGKEQEFDIETCGFTFLQHPHSLQLSAGEIKTEHGRSQIIEYLEEMSQFLRKTLRCNRSMCYDWRVRRAKAESVSSRPTFFTIPENGPARDFVLDVAQQVHADESPTGVRRILEHLLTADEKAEFESGKYRLRLINLWRPIVPRVENHALAVCDRRTVEENDWEPVDKVHKDWVEEGMYLRRQGRHKWYWLSNQTKEELIAFLVWDSDRSNEYNASTPHCSFISPEASSLRPPRESIELRFLVWDIVDPEGGDVPDAVNI